MITVMIVLVYHCNTIIKIIICMQFYTITVLLVTIVVTVVIQRVQLFATPWTVAHQASMSFPVSWSLLKLMSTESVMPSNHLILFHSCLLLPSIFPSIKVFSNESVLHIRCPKYWSFSFSFSISPSNEYSIQGWFPLGLIGLIFLLSKGLSKVFSNTTVQKYHSWHLAFFMVQLSHPYMTTGKNIFDYMGLCWRNDVSAF